MAPLHRRTNLKPTVIGGIVGLVSLVIVGAFCTVIFCVMCRKQRQRKKAIRKMQEDQLTPFVGYQYTVPAGAQSNPQGALLRPQELDIQEPYRGPQELQGSGRLAPLPPQQIDGYAAAPTFDDDRPLELPAGAAYHGTDAKRGIYR
ncbi:hypothetical protein COCHEDRAFT_1205957 [Bipolaris maydis C5]|uniref:Uncharacterized protein n=2 Tax=Cochliobolus heterostrophus TaxID=5016 RepID=M2ULM7_COCH5|nr:hypothetical protein COCHEDRAFT_1205957 [Bipolaris maydis C5]KAJ5028578.1 hypothetical protein J3E73DRAFT_379848 [Bipolaris maydis]KAJ5063358.1 hypothetical protein J3E74DRAFT_472342 [Bipolaris maydis]KAJ6205774.1 hypothetical protein PSV09DRAFT_1205957 [Bipolaris maydis]KAJ6272750.1 hypothetical protein PSV08DRAFT_360603 [Bipolaris maydis]